MSESRETTAPKEPYRILALDGGGLRGIVSARVLQHIESDFPEFLGAADLVAGTSAGAINTVAIGLGINGEKLVTLYQDQAETICGRSIWDRLATGDGIYAAAIPTERRLKGIVNGLENGTGKPVTNVKLGDIQRKILITSFQLDSHNPICRSESGPRRWKAKIFHNFKDDGDGGPNPDLAQKAVDVVMRSSAAPTEFPIYQGFTDGALLANNPVMCAIAQALHPSLGCVKPPQHIVALSIGTGAAPAQYLHQRSSSWGYIQWAQYSNLFVDAFLDVADFQANQILGRDRYFRVNPVLSGNSSSSDPAAEPFLVESVDKYFGGEPGHGKSDEWTDLKKWLGCNWSVNQFLTQPE